MAACPNCQEEMRRLRRTALQRLMCSRLYRCDSCSRSVRWPHRRVRGFTSGLSWLFALHTTCVRCAGTKVRPTQAFREGVPGRTLLQAIQQWVESCRYRCPQCNLSYFDFRATQSRRSNHRPALARHRRSAAPERAAELPQRIKPLAPELPPLISIRIRKRRRVVRLATAQDRARVVHEDRTHAAFAPLLRE